MSNSELYEPFVWAGKEKFKERMLMIAKEVMIMDDDIRRWAAILKNVAIWNKDRYLHASKAYTIIEYEQTVKRLLSTPIPSAVADIATQWVVVDDSHEIDDYEIMRRLSKCLMLIKYAHKDIPIFLRQVRADGFDD